jgi:hypothetical protein
MDKLKAGQTLTVNVDGINYTGKIKTLGMEPVKIKEEWVYPVDVVFPSNETLRAGAPAQLKMP